MTSNPSPANAPTTVSLDDEEAVKRIVTDTLFGLWATANNLSRLRPSRRERYRVTVFGSARTEPDHWVYQQVKRMCAALQMLRPGFELASAKDMQIPRCVDGADHAIAVIREHHARRRAGKTGQGCQGGSKCR